MSTSVFRPWLKTRENTANSSFVLPNAKNDNGKLIFSLFSCSDIGTFQARYFVRRCSTGQNNDFRFKNSLCVGMKRESLGFSCVIRVFWFVTQHVYFLVISVLVRVENPLF